MAVIQNAVDLEGLAEFLDGCDGRFAAKGDVPTDTAQLANGAGYVTSEGLAQALPQKVGDLPG